jgi:IS5 family transposase
VQAAAAAATTAAATIAMTQAVVTKIHQADSGASVAADKREGSRMRRQRGKRAPRLRKSDAQVYILKYVGGCVHAWVRACVCVRVCACGWVWVGR